MEACIAGKYSVLTHFVRMLYNIMMSENFLFEPDPESPIGMPMTIWDPDTGRETEVVIATDGFRVEVTAGDYDTMPGVSFYAHEEDRVIFGFLMGIGDIDTSDIGVMTEEVVFPTFMSRHESPLSVIDYKQELERALESGRFIVASQLNVAE